MKKILFILSLVIVTSVFTRARAQEKPTDKIDALFDSIKSCYKDVKGYMFEYGMSDIAQNGVSKDGTTHLSASKDKSCTGKCLCDKKIMMRIPELTYAFNFSINSFDPNASRIKDSKLYLNNKQDNIYLTHPDAAKLKLVHHYLKQIYYLCK